MTEKYKKLFTSVIKSHSSDANDYFRLLVCDAEEMIKGVGNSIDYITAQCLSDEINKITENISKHEDY